MNYTSLRINLVNRSGFAKTLFVLIAWSMMATQCSKQIAQADEADADRQSSLQRSQKTSTLTVNAYPGDPLRPVHSPIAGSAFFAGITQIEPAWLEIRNNNDNLYLIFSGLPWRATQDNLSIWIGTATSSLPLAPNGQPQAMKFPIQLTVEPNTDKYCVEIEFAVLSQYFNKPVTCDSDFSLMVHGDLMHNGKACKVWAGNNKNAGTTANNIYYWFNEINAYCGSDMPNP